MTGKRSAYRRKTITMEFRKIKIITVRTFLLSFVISIGRTPQKSVLLLRKWNQQLPRKQNGKMWYLIFDTTINDCETYIICIPYKYIYIKFDHDRVPRLVMRHMKKPSYCTVPSWDRARHAIRDSVVRWRPIPVHRQRRGP